MNDARPPGSLGAFLRGALPEPPLPAGFAHAVLRRIHRDDAPWLQGIADIVSFLKRPFSMAIMTLAMAVGAWDGLRDGAGDARVRAERAHVLAVDPESSAFTP